MARDEPVAPNATIAAATMNNEQNTLRHRDGVNVWVEIVIMEVRASVGLSDRFFTALEWGEAAELAEVSVSDYARLQRQKYRLFPSHRRC